MKLKIKNHLLVCIALVISVLSACTFNRTYRNRPDDIQKGKLFVNNFYNYISNKKYDILDLMTSDTLSSLAGKHVISKIAKLVNNKVGFYKNYSIVDSSTTRSEGDDNERIYKFKIKVTYERGIVGEVIGLEKLGTSDIKIISYNVYSDLLMH